MERFVGLGGIATLVENEELVTLTDGITLRVRPLRPADADELRRMYERTSTVTRYRRFMAPVPRLSANALRYLTAIGPDRIVLVALYGARIVAEARAHRLRGCEAEFAVLVEDAWQARGLGKAMSALLTDHARAAGIETFTGSMLADNTAARALLRSTYPMARWQVSQGELVFRIPLVEPALRRCS